MKRYDKAYFDRWYRHSHIGRQDTEFIRKRARQAVAMVEIHLGRRIETVIDIGAGEGRWQPHLLEVRPDIDYLGVDSSKYAIAAFGAERNIIHGKFEDLHDFYPQTFDLVICSDVLHYLTEEQIRTGIDGLVSMVGGVAYLWSATDDEIVLYGDTEGFTQRSIALYEQWFFEAGLQPLRTSAGEMPWFYVPQFSRM